MSFNQFTNLDFNDLRTQIKDYLRANTNFTDFDFEGSNFSVLIDTLAYNSYITSYNTNMAVNESFIDSATLRENVVSLARNIGYVPRSKKASVARVSFTVDASGLSSRSIKLHAGVVALGAVESGNYIYSIPEDITVSPDSNGIANFNNISIYEGSLIRRTFTVDDSQPNAKYILPNANIDTSTIRVKVTSTITEDYTEYTNIFDVTSTTKMFLIQEVEDEKYQILFGDGVFGKKPPNGSKIEVTYIVTNGEEANNSTNFTFSGELTYIRSGLDRKVTSGVSLLSTLESSRNGSDIESIDKIKYLAPRVYASQYRAVTTNDYVSLIPQLYSNVESVSVYGGEELDPPQYGKVFIAIKPKNGENISTTTKDSIRSDLKKYTVAGIKQEFIDTKYLYVEFNSGVSFNPSFTQNRQDLYSRIISTIESYSRSSDINSFGGRFKYSKFVSLIDKVDNAITSNITKVKMRRNMLPAYNSLANYELCYANRFHADLEGFNIKSSGFKISGVDGVVYLTDLPNPSNPRYGIIRFFNLVDGNVNYINNNAGSVDYLRGEIIVNPVVIESSSLDNRIEIEVIPESNDIVAKENLYIVLDTTANSNLSLIEDIVSSGSNSSGVGYIPPSSFINRKTYTR